MTVDAALFRSVLGRLAGGVAVVTTRDSEGGARGMTATSVCSVSLSPPLVLACLSRTSETHEGIADSGAFALNFLAEGEERLARRFAGDRTDKYAGLDTAVAATGAPILPGALAWCDCVVEEARVAGDHTIYVGRVEEAGATAGDDRAPLVYYRGRYAGLTVGERTPGAPPDPPARGGTP